MRLGEGRGQSTDPKTADHAHPKASGAVTRFGDRSEKRRHGHTADGESVAHWGTTEGLRETLRPGHPATRPADQSLQSTPIPKRLGVPLDLVNARKDEDTATPGTVSLWHPDLKTGNALTKMNALTQLCRACGVFGTRHSSGEIPVVRFEDFTAPHKSFGDRSEGRRHGHTGDGEPVAPWNWAMGRDDRCVRGRESS